MLALSHNLPLLPVGSEPARWIDVCGLALVLGFALLGARRGVWWQALRLLGLVAGVALARALAPRLAELLAEVFPGLHARAGHGLAWALVLVVAFLLVAWIGHRGSEAAGTAVPPTLLARAAGAGLGAVCGVVVHIALLLCLGQAAAPEWAEVRLEGTHSQRWVALVDRSVPGLVEVHAAETLGLERARD